MRKLAIQPMFFLGANSPSGFVSQFDSAYLPLQGWHTYIIKGGPGTGKSTLMKRVADCFLKEGIRCHLCPCSSDPSSLDGVIFPDLKVVVLDGTAPHVVEPRFPGAVEEIINLGDCWKAGELRLKRDEIIALTAANKLYHQKASNYLRAAGAMREDIKNSAAAVTDFKKARSFGQSLSKKHIPKASGEAIEWRRYLSGVTPRGHIFYKRTVESLCNDRVLISDAFGAAAPAILEEIREYALKNGYEIITCRCPLNPTSLEHIIIPSLKLYFGTANKYHAVEPTERVIHARRFMSMKAFHEERGRANFARKTLLDMINLAADALSDAKSTHDELESFYIAAMDRDKLSQKTDALIKTITGLDIGQI